MPIKRNKILRNAEKTYCRRKMANRSVILQKKLHELESELADITRLPPGPTSSGPRLQMAFDDIKQRFIFLNKLLLREIASQPQNSGQLRRIGQRLTVLEATFLKWNEWRLSVCSDCTQALLLQGDARESDSPISEIEIFSCEKPPEKLLCNFATEKSSKREDWFQVVPYDDVCKSRSDSISDSENFSADKTPEKFFNSLEKDGNVRNEEAEAVVVAVEEKMWSKVRKFGGVFGCGVIVGAICMVKLFFVSPPHSLISYEALLLPPT